jgi:hypothetical protein
VTATSAFSRRIIFKKFNLLAALGAIYLKNRAGLPVLSVLSWAFLASIECLVLGISFFIFSLFSKRRRCVKIKTTFIIDYDPTQYYCSVP